MTRTIDAAETEVLISEGAKKGLDWATDKPAKLGALSSHYVFRYVDSFILQGDDDAPRSLETRYGRGNREDAQETGVETDTAAGWCTHDEKQVDFPDEVWRQQDPFQIQG